MLGYAMLMALSSVNLRSLADVSSSTACELRDCQGNEYWLGFVTVELWEANVGLIRGVSRTGKRADDRFSYTSELLCIKFVRSGYKTLAWFSNICYRLVKEMDNSFEVYLIKCILCHYQHSNFFFFFFSKLPNTSCVPSDECKSLSESSQKWHIAHTHTKVLTYVFRIHNKHLNQYLLKCFYTVFICIFICAFLYCMYFKVLGIILL